MNPWNRATPALALLATAALAAVASPAAPARAEWQPEKPITFVVGFGAGGGTDAVARATAAEIEKQRGWEIIVENKPGASGSVMASYIKNQAPDGYRIGMAGTEVVSLTPLLRDDSDYTWEDFEYLGTGNQLNYGLVARADAPFDTLDGLAAYAKEEGQATVGAAGRNQQLAVELIARRYGANIVNVPVQGAADAMKSALGGHVDATTQGSNHVQQIKAGRMKLIAAMTGSRHDYAPDVKTLRESGVDIALETYIMFMVPKGVPAEVKDALAAAIDDAVKSDSFTELMAKFDNKPINLGQEGLTESIRRSNEAFRALLQQ